MAFSVDVVTPYGRDRVENVVNFGPEERDKNILLLLGENDEQLGVYNAWVSARKVQE